jgi:hypothetical protein
MLTLRIYLKATLVALLLFGFGMLRSGTPPPPANPPRAPLASSHETSMCLWDANEDLFPLSAS